ncbi:MAG: hypothetical protein GY765_31520 [bacterium]|nr:hypothetical protein [bacterium]
MIRPHKRMNPQFSVINIGGLIIRALKENRMLNFDQLLAHLAAQTSDEVKEVYLPSLSFLYIIGKLVYHQENDSFQLVE